MNTHVTATNLVITDEIRAYFDSHVEKVGKLVHDESARLVVEFERLTEHKTDNEFRAELMLYSPGLELRSESSSGTLHGAIDEAVDQLQYELRKVKGKKQRLFRLEGLKFKNWLRGWR